MLKININLIKDLCVCEGVPNNKTTDQSPPTVPNT